MEEFNIVEQLLGMTLLGTEWVLWLLIILSVVSVAIIAERIRFYWQIRLDFHSFSSRLTQLIIDRKEDALLELCRSSPSLESQTLVRGLENRDRGPRAMEEAMTGYLIGERSLLDRGLVVLGTLGNNAPFIGLFGTVLGIIQAFADLAENPDGGPAVVMAGISEALVATAVGLLVAIPAVIAFNAFQRLVKRHVANTESLIKIVLSRHESAS